MNGASLSQVDAARPRAGGVDVLDRATTGLRPHELDQACGGERREVVRGRRERYDMSIGEPSWNAFAVFADAVDDPWLHLMAESAEQVGIRLVVHMTEERRRLAIRPTLLQSDRPKGASEVDSPSPDSTRIGNVP
jgi:hypothetical protein